MELIRSLRTDPPPKEPAPSQTVEEAPPTVEEVDLYFTARWRLPSPRLRVLARYASRFPNAELFYQEFRRELAVVDKEINNAILHRR